MVPQMVQQIVNGEVVIGNLNRMYGRLECVYTLRSGKLVPRCPTITVNNTMKQATTELVSLYLKIKEGKTNV